MTKSLRFVCPLVVLLLGLACGGGGSGSAARSSDPAPPGAPPAAPTPSPPSVPAPSTITSVTFDWSSHRRLAEGSDNWPTTWADDDQQYAIWGDGGGFGGTDADGRSSFGVARIEGARDNYTGVNRFGGKSGNCPSAIDGKAHGAPLSVGGVLFTWVTPGSGPGGYDRFTLYSSLDKGCSWGTLEVTFTLAADGIGFGSFVQFGKDNQSARDAYVYTVSTAVTDASSLDIVQRPGKIMLMRVPATDLQDRSAYQFYAGADGAGQPTWSSDAASKVAIYEDPTGAGAFSQMTYVPDLDRFVYTNQHGNGIDASATRSLLTMAQAAQPWGPWTVFYRDIFFPQIEQSVFQWSFAPKWFANAGHDFTLIFSGTGSNDSWNTVNGVFTTSP